MIKVGDKFIAKEDFEICDNEIMEPFSYKKGEIIEIVIIYHKQLSFPIHVTNNKNEEHNFSYAEIDKYFISLAEFRDKRIDEILYEE